MKKLIFLLLLLPAFLFGQTSKKDSIWMALKTICRTMARSWWR